MDLRDLFKPDPTCPHGKPLQVSCPHCTQPQRNRAIDQATGQAPKKAKSVDPRTRTSGTYKTSVTGKTTKTGRNAKR